MKAIILAAGYDYNLKELIDVPKTLLKVGAKTILERQLDSLKKAGLNDADIYVVSGYKSEMITAIHKNTIQNNKFEEFGNSYSLYLALDRVLHDIPKDSDEPIIISDGDLVFDEKLISEIMQSKKENILITRKIPYSPDISGEIIISDENTNLITSLIVLAKGQPLSPSYKDEKLSTFIGLLKLSAKTSSELLAKLAVPSHLKGWYSIPLAEIVGEHPFYNQILPEDIKFCFDINNPKDFNKIKNLGLLNNKTDDRIRKLGYKMFVAGPVNVHDDVKEAMIYGEIGHREPEFEEVFADVKKGLLSVFGANKEDYGVVVIGGSGTSATETALSSILHSNKKTLVVSNGAFGERMAEICEHYNIPTLRLHNKWGEYPSLKEIEDKIKTEKDIEAVCMVLMETSTGMLNPIREAGLLCKKYNKIFIVDAVSSLGGEVFNMVQDNADYCIANTNKCLGGLPVLGIVCYKKAALEKSKDVKPRSYYLDLFKHIKYAEKNQTPFTPQIPLFFMLRAALDKIMEEGVHNKISRYKKNGDILKKRLKDTGFSFELKDNEMSNLMVNAIVPEGFTYQELHDKLKDKGYITYPGKGALEGKVIHIANIGTLKEEDVVKFCDDVEEVVNNKTIIE